MAKVKKAFFCQNIFSTNNIFVPKVYSFKKLSLDVFFRFFIKFSGRNDLWNKKYFCVKGISGK